MKKLPSWKEVEADFRLWSFYVYYKKSFATMKDNHMRFAHALCMSVAPIRDRAKVWEWWDLYQRNNASRNANWIDPEKM